MLQQSGRNIGSAGFRICNEDFRKMKEAKHHLYYQHFNGIKCITITYDDSTSLSGKYLNTFQKCLSSKPHLFPWNLKEKVEKKKAGGLQTYR